MDDNPMADDRIETLEERVARLERPRRLLTRRQVEEKTGLTKSTIYERVAAGTFPCPVKVGSRSLWPEHEVDAWIDARIAERDGGAAA